MTTNTKGIEFKVNLNTQDANKQIADLQQKLQSIQKNSGYSDRAKSVFGADSSMSKESQKIFNDQKSSDVKYLRDKFNALQKNKELADKILQRSQEGSKQEQKDLERQIQLREKLFTIQKQQVDIAEKAKTIDPSLAGFSGVTPPPNTPGPGSAASGAIPNVPPTPPSPDLMGGIIKAIGISKLANMIGQGISGTANFAAASVFEYGQDKARSQANITQSLAQGNGLNSLMAGRGSEIGFFGKERSSARLNAQEALKGMTLRESGGHLAAAIGGAATGGAIGSIIPGIGTAIGATVGGLGALGTSVMSSSTGAGLKSLVGEGSFEAGKERFRSEKFAKDFASNMETERAKNPIRTKAYDFFEENRPRMLQAQQMSGMGDAQMLDTMGAGGGLYTQQQKFGMMQGIAGAGGSSAQMRNGVEGLNLQRGYGIQNAAGVMGMLSSGLGGGQSAGDATTERVLAKAFKVGLDSSNFSRETEKFLVQSAQFISDSGARTIEAQARVANMDTGLSTGTSMKDVEATGTGRQAFNTALGSGGSQYSKALQMSKMRSDKDLTGLDQSQKTYLTNMSPDQIAAGGPIFDSIAEEAGLEPDELREKLIGKGGAKEFGATYTPKQQANVDKLRKLKEKYGNVLNPETFQKQIANAKSPEEKQEIQDAQAEASQALGSLVPSLQSSGIIPAGSTQQQGMAFAGNLFGMGTQTGNEDTAPRQAQGLAVAGEKAQAKSEALTTELFSKYAQDYETASKSILTQSTAFVEALINMTEALKTGDSKSLWDKIKESTSPSMTPNYRFGKDQVKPGSK